VTGQQVAQLNTPDIRHVNEMDVPARHTITKTITGKMQHVQLQKHVRHVVEQAVPHLDTVTLLQHVRRQRNVQDVA
jgi:hypothetical protein